MSKLVTFLGTVDRSFDPATISMDTVLDAARHAGLGSDELAALTTRDSSAISRLISLQDPAVSGQTYNMVQISDAE